ncbi:DUF6538 domain-containing protein [Pseudomonas syringae]|uniref:DUF6538 domain-containing protein n=1 Tax=Pseudomonas syringae TaxID=317 RepID=UPI0039B6FB48
MTQRDNLYRRSSGIYVLRITVPARYRAQVRQQEIHVSTKTTNLKAAKAVASHLLVQWHCSGLMIPDTHLGENIARYRGV